ncbi:MAG: tyrosine-type recombinase/integrase [Lachnospiraceae bacterium]|nr:tyrosine-type recombinase/integrase [Lachnospiraceae bacterium]
MAESRTYHEESDEKNILKLRQLRKQLPDFASDFFRGIESRTSARTRVGYAYDLITFFHYLKEETRLLKGRDYETLPVTFLEEITISDLEDYVSYLSLYIDENGIKRTNKPAAKKRKLSALKSFYRYYYKREMISKNPTDLLDMPKLEKKAIVRMEANEVADLMDHVETGEQLSDKQLAFHQRTVTRDMALIALMLGTGIRVSECVGLNLDDLNMEETAAKVYRKGGKEQIVYFGDEVKELLIPYLAEREKKKPEKGHEDALFLSLQNRRISVRAVEKLVKKYTRTVTTLKKITPHKLRSTFGTALYQETGDIYLVASVLGHSDINTTMAHYADMEEQRRRSARNIVKIRKDD